MAHPMGESKDGVPRLDFDRRLKLGFLRFQGHFRQSVFGRLGGYDDVNDADRLSLDPIMRWIASGHAVAK